MCVCQNPFFVDDKQVDVVGYGGKLDSAGDELKLCYQFGYSKEPFCTVQLAKSSSCCSTMCSSVFVNKIFYCNWRRAQVAALCMRTEYLHT